MFNFLPWMDEVHIVEMGRNFLSGASSADGTILFQAGVRPFVPPYYLGPVLQELVFRAFGEQGVRLSPILGMLLSAMALAWFMKQSGRYSRFSIIATSLLAATLPLLAQSVRLVRLDSWVFFLGFAVCGLLAVKRYKTAAFIAVLSPFVWPSAVMLAPMYLMVHIEGGESSKKVVVPSLLALCALLIFLIPVFRIFSTTIGSLSNYFAEHSGGSIAGGNLDILGQFKKLAVPVIKETLRAPFFFLVAYVGVVLSFRKRRILVYMFLIACVFGSATGMHTFRYIYLMPYFLLFAAEALDFVYRKTPVVAWTSVVVTAFYGLACGPLAYIVADINRPAGVIDAKIAEAFKDVPPGTRVFSPGYSTYYAFRRRGLVQIALADSPLYANEKLTASLLDKCEYALLESEDKYAAIEESYTLYGLFRDLCLSTARRESTLERKSILGKIGEAFAYGTRPPVEHILRASGFSRTTHSFSHSGREYVVFRKMPPRSTIGTP